MDFRNIGKALRWLRNQRGKKQREVAAAAGITPAMLSAYETGKHRPSLDTTERVLTALECDVVELTRALLFVERQDRAMKEGKAVSEVSQNLRGSDLVSIFEGSIGPARLEAAERDVLASLLPGVLSLIRYLKG